MLRDRYDCDDEELCRLLVEVSIELAAYVEVRDRADGPLLWCHACRGRGEPGHDESCLLVRAGVRSAGTEDRTHASDSGGEA